MRGASATTIEPLHPPGASGTRFTPRPVAGTACGVGTGVNVGVGDGVGVTVGEGVAVAVAVGGGVGVDVAVGDGVSVGIAVGVSVGMGVNVGVGVGVDVKVGAVVDVGTGVNVGVGVSVGDGGGAVAVAVGDCASVSCGAGMDNEGDCGSAGLAGSASGDQHPNAALDNSTAMPHQPIRLRYDASLFLPAFVHFAPSKVPRPATQFSVERMFAKSVKPFVMSPSTGSGRTDDNYLCMYPLNTLKTPSEHPLRLNGSHAGWVTFRVDGVVVRGPGCRRDAEQHKHDGRGAAGDRQESRLYAEEDAFLGVDGGQKRQRD